MATSSTEAAPGDGRRSEAPLERADRNYAELVQEMRVLLVGVQILFGFLLTLAFNPGFDELDGFQHALYVVTLLSTAASSALLIGPVAMHRLLFQGGHKPELVRGGHRLTVLALVGLGMTLSGGLLLVLDITVGRVAAIAVTAAFVAGVVVVWWVLPLRMRRAG